MLGVQRDDVRQLVVCCDGTWQTAATDGNVARLWRALAGRDVQGRPQLVTYLRGVGTAGSPWNRLRGGLTGAGLTQHVLQGYRWLVRHYRPGDQVSLFGFSRGAYTARSLAGMIGACGLLDPSGLDGPALTARIERAHRHYRERDRDPADRSWRAGLRLRWDPEDPISPVRFVGVWDTVGALGVPAHLGPFTMLRARERVEFHDVRLDPRVPHARHAVALDEMRGPFRPTLWCEPAPGQDVHQVWFPGDHLDVGGGHRSRDLSDGALRWMIEQAAATVGLGFDPATVAGFAPNPLGVAHPRDDLVSTLLEPLRELTMRPRPRAVPRVAPGAPDVHVSAVLRQRATDLPGGPYRPTRTPQPGTAHPVEVPAARAWCAPGLFLEPGDYRFEAEGRWRSLTRWSGPQGRDRLGRYGPLLERAVAGYRRAVHDPHALVPGARREPDLPWLSLVALVANERRDERGRPRPGDDRIAVGPDGSARLTRPGYLFAFANDAWGAYADNGGALRLTVTRTR